MAGMASNPFTPTFGKVPFAIAGREDYIDDAIGGLAGLPGDPFRSIAFYGPRGSGKTVLLEEIARIASGQGWICATAIARRGMLNELFWLLRSRADHLLSADSAFDIVSLQVGPLGATREMRRDQEPWLFQMERIIRELNDQGVGVLFAIDEADPACEEFREFIGDYQSFVREDLDVALFIGGLPGKVSSLLVDESISFIRRAFQRPLGAISRVEVEQALLDTIVANGRRIDPEALAMCADATGGYAYAIQLVGFYLWRQTPPDRDFKPEDAQLAIRLMLHEMERTVFIPTLHDLRAREEDYLRAMAQDDRPSNTGDVAKRMGIGMTNASNLRRRLIDQGIIREVRMGVVEFDMPLLGDYLRSKL